MLQYLVILLDDTSVSYCHYDNRKSEHRLISLENLKEGILFAMKENLMLQFVYPHYELPQAYKNAAEKAQALLDKAMSENNSVGGIVECVVTGMPAGVGEPVFDKLDASLAKAVLSIGATKGIEFGLGFKAAKAMGSENNDEFYMDNGKVVKYTNNSGGILGGFSDGSDIVFRTVFKPTPSISLEQKTVNNSGENTTISITGRHDPIIAPRK